MKYFYFSVLAFTLVSLVPYHHTYANTDPLDGYCKVVQMDAKLTGSIGGNLKTLCP